MVGWAAASRNSDATLNIDRVVTIQSVSKICEIHFRLFCFSYYLEYLYYQSKIISMWLGNEDVYQIKCIYD